MEKQGEIRPGLTPDIEKKLPAGEKQSQAQAATKALDDDARKRAADAAADKLR